jgi:hypothetical protein
MALGQLALALAKAQLQMKVPKKTQTVDFTDKQGRRIKYSYAELSDIIECYRKPLNEHCMVLSSSIDIREHGLVLITSLIHESGETLDSVYPLPDPSTVSAQMFGSALTYARRYSTCALLGIAAEDDDDGASAGDTAATRPARKAKAAPPDPEVIPREVRELRAKNEAIWDERDRMMAQQFPESGSAPPPPDGTDELSSLNSWESYHCSFGKFSGKTIRQIGVAEAAKYVAWLRDNESRTGKKIQGPAKEFCDMVDQAVAASDGQNQA